MANDRYTIASAAPSARQALLRLATERRDPALAQLAQDPNDEKVVQAMVGLRPEAASKIEGYDMGAFDQFIEGGKQGLSMGFWGDTPRSAAPTIGARLLEQAPYYVGKTAGSLVPLLAGGGALAGGLKALQYGKPLAYGIVGAIQSALSSRNDLDTEIARGAEITPDQRDKMVGLSALTGGVSGLAPAASTMTRGALWNTLGSAAETAGNDVIMGQPWSQTLSQHPGLTLGLPAALGAGLTRLQGAGARPPAGAPTPPSPARPSPLPLGADAEALLAQLAGDLPTPPDFASLRPAMTAMDLVELNDIMGGLAPSRLRQVATPEGTWNILGKSQVKKGFYRGQSPTGDFRDLAPDDVLQGAKLLDVGGRPTKLASGYQQAGNFRTPRGDLLGVTPSGSHAALLENGVEVHGVPVEEIQGLRDYLVQREQQRAQRRPQGTDTRKSLAAGQVPEVLRTKGGQLTQLAGPLEQRMAAIDAALQPAAAPPRDPLAQFLPFGVDELEFIQQLNSPVPRR